MLDEPEYGRGCVVAGIGAIVVSAVVAAVVVAVLAAGWGQVLQGREVGPDADAMAEDPLLQVELADARAGEIFASTGTEGGIVPAMANRTSVVFRVWTADGADWRSLLVEAVDEAGRHGVRWRQLSYHADSVEARGVKDLAVDGELVPATVSVVVRGIGTASSPPTVMIRFDSQGMGSATAPSTGAGLSAPEDCPSDIPDL